MAECPTQEALEQYLEVAPADGPRAASRVAIGGTPGSDVDAAAIERHLSSCDACRAVSERIRSDRALAADLRAAARLDDESGIGAGPDATSEAQEARSPPPPEIDGYTLNRPVSRTHMSVVFDAIQDSTGQRVAVKVLREGWFTSGRARRRFEREVELARTLRHEGIVPIMDAGIGEGQLFFAMPFVEGTDPVSFAEEARLSVTDRIGLLRRMCEPLRYAHQRGVIHRDLKPSNILIDASGAPHVLDFGLAKIADSTAEATELTYSGQLLGTPAFMAPEQAEGRNRDVDVRTDVYALGVMAYRMLAGRMPYAEGLAIAETLEHIRRTEPAAPSRHNRELSGEMDAVVMMALAKRPAERYESVAAMADDFDRLLSDRPISARQHSRLYLLRKTIARNPGWAAAAVLAVLSLVVVCVAALVVASQRRATIAALAEKSRQQEARLADLDARRRALTHYYQAIDLIRRQVRRDDALALIDKSLEIDPTFSAAYLERGILRCTGGFFRRIQTEAKRRTTDELPLSKTFLAALRRGFADFDRAHEYAGGDWLVDPNTGRRLAPAEARALPVAPNGRLIHFPDVVRRGDGALVRIESKRRRIHVGGPGFPRALVSAGHVIFNYLSWNWSGLEFDALLAGEMDRYFRRAAALDPRDVYTRLSPALAAATHPGRQAEAVRLLEALTRDAEAAALVELWHTKASVYLGGPRRLIPEYHPHRDPVRAERAARRATALAPFDVSGWYLLGLALQAQGRFDEAVEVNRRALRLQEQPAVGVSSQTPPMARWRGPLVAEVLTNLATCHAMMGRFESAWTLYDHAYSYSGRSPIVLLERAEAHHRDGRTAEARADLAEALRFSTDAGIRPLPNVALATAWSLLTFPDRDLRKPGAARRLLERLRQRRPWTHDPAVLTLLIYSCCECGDPAAASELVSVFPSSDSLPLFAEAVRTMVLAAAGRRPEAREVYRRVQAVARRASCDDPRLALLLDEVRRALPSAPRTAAPDQSLPR